MAISWSAGQRQKTPGTYQISGIRGLYLLISETGHRSWIWRGTQKATKTGPVTRTEGIPHWIVIQDIPKDQDLHAYLDRLCSQLRAVARAGKDPRSLLPSLAADTGCPTCQEAWEVYIQTPGRTQKISKAWAQANLSLWNRDIKPKIGSIQLDHITPDLALTCTERLNKKGCTTTANRVRTVAHRFWRWARLRYAQYLQGRDNPWATVELHRELPSERYYSADELRALGRAYLNPDVHILHRHTLLWLLLIGSRRGIASCLDLDSWATDHPQILEIPRGVPGAKGARWLLMGRYAQALLPKTDMPLNLQTLTYAMTQWTRAAGVDDAGGKIHIGRKTFSSVGISLGYPAEYLDKVTNHKGNKVQQAYHRPMLEKLLPVVQAIEDELLRLMGLQQPEPKKSAIIRLGRRNIRAVLKFPAKKV